MGELYVGEDGSSSMDSWLRDALGLRCLFGGADAP